MTNKTVKELREIAKERNIKGYSKLKKDELVELLREPTIQEKFEKTLSEDVELIVYKDQENWLETRKLGIGGSDIAGILGQSKYKSPIDVWNDKVNSSNFTGNRYTRWGHNLEQPVALEFQALHEEYKVFEYNKTFKKGKALANVDRLLYDLNTGEYGVLEIKTSNFFGGKEWNGDTIPQEYYCQVMHYLAITGLKFAWIACLVGGNDYKEFIIERNDEECEFILKSCENFWNDYIATKNPPSPDGHDSYTEYLTEQMENFSDKIVEIEGLDEKVERIKEIEKNIKELDKESKLLKQELMVEMIERECKKAQGKNNKVSLVKGRSSVDKESFKKTYPEIFNSYFEKEKEFKVEGKSSIRIY